MNTDANKVFQVDNRSLSELLGEADKLFATKRRSHRTTGVINYSLNKFPSGWRFDVTNDWHKWLAAGLRSSTDIYDSPEAAVGAFLAFVESSKISVRRLMSW